MSSNGILRLSFERWQSRLLFVLDEQVRKQLLSLFMWAIPNRKIKNQSTHKKIEPTNHTDTLTNEVLQLFHQKYSSGAVRNVGVNYSGLVDESFGLVSLFDDVEKIEKEERLQLAIDSIRDQFGFTSLLKANALESASRSVARSKLIGGHSAGGLAGLK